MRESTKTARQMDKVIITEIIFIFNCITPSICLFFNSMSLIVY